MNKLLRVLVMLNYLPIFVVSATLANYFECNIYPLPVLGLLVILTLLLGIEAINIFSIFTRGTYLCLSFTGLTTSCVFELFQVNERYAKILLFVCAISSVLKVVQLVISGIKKRRQEIDETDYLSSVMQSTLRVTLILDVCYFVKNFVCV